MEKQALMNRFFEVSEGVRLNPRAGRGGAQGANQHRPQPMGSPLPTEGNPTVQAAAGDCAAAAACASNPSPNLHPRHPKDPHRMPPSARGVLRLLLQEEHVNQRSLAKALQITAPAVSDAVKKLEQRGMLRRTHGELNNEYILTLTDEGRTVAQQLDEKVRCHAETLFDGFTQEELDTLHALLEKMYHNMPQESL